MVIKVKSTLAVLLAAFLCSGMSNLSAAEESKATFNTESLTPETALKAASAALTSCRKQGYQVTVAIVDRAGIAQVILRDRFAGAHTPDTAKGKAWTAVSFRTNTTDIANNEKLRLSLAALPNVVTLGGGKMIEGAGSILGGIGVSGAPGASMDDACADVGISAIEEDILF